MRRMRRLVFSLSIALALAIGGALGYLFGRESVEEPNPATAPISLVQQCDEAGGIWMDREESETSPLLGGLPGFARVPGCYRQIGGATAWILDLEYSSEIAREWARANGYTQEDLINGIP